MGGRGDAEKLPATSYQLPAGAGPPQPQQQPTSASALFRRYPQLVGRMPWLPLGEFPTPLEPLPAQAAERLGADVWIKRDDLSSRVYGGNKVRKLEFLIAEAQRRGAQRLITIGAWGSHHGLATTIFGTRAGLAVTLVLVPQSVTPHVRDVLLAALALGAELVFVDGMAGVPLAVVRARRRHRRERPYFVPVGGSTPLSTLGYVAAALELDEQLRAGRAPEPGVVHAVAGTLGTIAGIALGLTLAGRRSRLVAARVSDLIFVNRLRLGRLLAATIRLLRRAGVDAPAARDVLRNVELQHQWIGRGYGHATPDSQAATELFAEFGIPLDQTYTAKAAAELVASLRAQPGGTHLFWHTLSAVDPVPARDRIHELPAKVRARLEGC